MGRKSKIETNNPPEKQSEGKKNTRNYYRIKSNHDILDKAIELFEKNPDITNHECAIAIGVNESTIRYWKKNPLWKKRKQEIQETLGRVLQKKIEKEENKYLKKLEEQQKELEIIRDAAKFTAMQAIRLANKAYTELSRESDAVIACSKGSNAGVHLHLKQGIDAISKIMSVNEQIHQFEIMRDYLEEAEEVEYEEIQEHLDNVSDITTIE